MTLRRSILHGWAQTLLFLGLNRAALRAFEDLTVEFPAHVEGWGVLGFLYGNQGEHGRAVTAFEKALALRGDDPAVCFNAAFAMQRSGDHERAMTLFQQALAMDPKLDRAWYGLGLSLAHAGRHEEAAARFREAARLQPLNPYAGYHLAAELQQLGRREEVLAEYRRVKDFDPKVSALMRRDFAIDEPDI